MGDRHNKCYILQIVQEETKVGECIILQRNHLESHLNNDTKPSTKVQMLSVKKLELVGAVLNALCTKFFSLGTNNIQFSLYSSKDNEINEAMCKVIHESILSHVGILAHVELNETTIQNKMYEKAYVFVPKIFTLVEQPKPELVFNCDVIGIASPHKLHSPGLKKVKCHKEWALGLIHCSLLQNLLNLTKRSLK